MSFYIVSLDGLAYIANMDSSVESGLAQDVIEVAQPPPCESAFTTATLANIGLDLLRILRISMISLE